MYGNWLLIARLLHPQGDAIDQAKIARDAVSSGIVEIHQYWDNGQVRSDYEATAYFDLSHYRLDIHATSAFPDVRVPDGRTFDPLRMYFDGQVLYERILDCGALHYSVRELNDTRVPLRNIRGLGLPRHPGKDLAVLAHFMPVNSDAETVSIASSGLSRITITPGEKPERGTTRLVVDVDPARGWSVVHYEQEIISLSGPHFRVIGDAIPAQYGSVWFPAWCRTTQYQGDQLMWTEEFFVSGAEFNVALPPDTFSLDGLGAYAGELVLSYVSGIPHRTHESNRVRPACAHQAAHAVQSDAAARGDSR